MAAKKEPKPALCRGPRFEPDPTTPPAPLPIADRGTRDPLPVCRWCGRSGEPGDAAHPLPEPNPALVAAALEQDRARLGEREDPGGGR